MGQPVPTKAIYSRAQTLPHFFPAWQWNCTPLSMPSFLLTQNIKDIARSDITRWRSHDGYYIQSRKVSNQKCHIKSTSQHLHCITNN